MFDKGYFNMIKMDTTHDENGIAYQIEPFDYYVKDFFLAKSLLYVLRYADDEILFEVALEEAAKAYKTSKELIKKHIQKIIPPKE